MRKALTLFLLLSVWSIEADTSDPITVPVSLHHGRIILTGKIADSRPLTFLLDSACTIPTLYPPLVDELKLSQAGRVRINGIAGEERAPTYRGVVIDLGGASYAPRRVAAIPSEREERRRRDGVLDAGFFRAFVVKFDAGKKHIQLYSPTNFVYGGAGEILPFRFREEIPIITAEVVLTEGKSISAEFEVDTGCDSGLCLGESFIKQHNLINLIDSRDSEKFGIGGSVETKIGHLPAMKLGNRQIKNVQADFFLKGSPVDEPAAGHVGMALLGKHTFIFDYARKRLILE